MTTAHPAIDLTWPSMKANFWAENRLVLAHVYTSTAALAVGTLLGLLQAFSRANWLVMPAWLDYYRALTAHGVLLALVFTTFFITGLSLFSLYRTIPREHSMSVGWLGYWLMLIGTLTTAITILSGNATVLYTFYAPLKAHPAFYLGATTLVLGTWCVGYEVLDYVLYFRRSSPGQPLPLVVHGVACTFLMWFIATVGIVLEMLMLIPWSLGWIPGVDVMLTRMLFWYFGHPLVYFWIMGAYVIWYNMIPTTYGGKTFSDPLTRLAFVMLLLLSTPVGLHHEFLDPGISAGWKWLHTLTTYGVVIPSFMTAFAIFASFELAMQRQGRRGFVATVRGLPWSDPTFSGSALGMILFIFGGFGGLINSSYSMDVLVHNTMWIVGHFHITVGGPVALTFIGAAYRLVPALTGRKLWNRKLAVAQTWLYFVGMAMMSLSMHVAGLLGAPRRTSDVTYMGMQGAQSWHVEMLLVAVGGTLIYISILMFVTIAVATRFVDEPAETEFPFAVTDEERAPPVPVLDRIFRWGAVAIALAILAYVGPVTEMLQEHAYLVSGVRTW